MQLMETESATNLRAKLVRMSGGVTGMVAAIVLSAVFHVSPVMAESRAASTQQDAQSTPAQGQLDSSPDAEQSDVPEDSADSGKVRVEQKKEIHIHPDGKRVVIINGVRRDPTPEEQREIDQQMADAQRELANTDAMLQGEFKHRMDDVKRQMIEVQVHLNSEGIQHQIAEASRQATEFALHKEEFKQQMADLQKQLQSGEFQRQITEATRQATGPAFRADLQREIDKAIKSLKDVQEQLKKESNPVSVPK